MIHRRFAPAFPRLPSGIRPGEILGIAGIDGNGQKLLAEALPGQRAISAGTVALDGRPSMR